MLSNLAVAAQKPATSVAPGCFSVLFQRGIFKTLLKQVFEFKVLFDLMAHIEGVLKVLQILIKVKEVLISFSVLITRWSLKRWNKDSIVHVIAVFLHLSINKNNVPFLSIVQE